MNKRDRNILRQFKNAPLQQQTTMIVTLKHELHELNELLKKMEWELK